MRSARRRTREAIASILRKGHRSTFEHKGWRAFATELLDARHVRYVGVRRRARPSCPPGRKARAIVLAITRSFPPRNRWGGGVIYRRGVTCRAIASVAEKDAQALKSRRAQKRPPAFWLCRGNPQSRFIKPFDSSRARPLALGSARRGRSSSMTRRARSAARADSSSGPSSRPFPPFALRPSGSSPVISPGWSCADTRVLASSPVPFPGPI